MEYIKRKLVVSIVNYGIIKVVNGNIEVDNQPATEIPGVLDSESATKYLKKLMPDANIVVASVRHEKYCFSMELSKFVALADRTPIVLDSSDSADADAQSEASEENAFGDESAFGEELSEADPSPSPYAAPIPPTPILPEQPPVPAEQEARYDDEFFGAYPGFPGDNSFFGG